MGILLLHSLVAKQCNGVQFISIIKADFFLIGDKLLTMKSV